MTDEERQRQMDFILNQQAQFSVNIQKLEESQLRFEKAQTIADGRIDRLERIAKLMVRAGLRARRQMREQDERYERRFAAFTDALIAIEDRFAANERRFAESFTAVTDALAALAKAQTRTEESIAHTDRRLDALIDIVNAGRNGRS